MGSGSEVVEGIRSWPLSAKLLIVSSIVTILGFSAICGSVMLDMRHGEAELARQTAENLASGIDSDINRNIELYDLSLRAVVSSMAMPEIADVSKPIRHLILFDHAATAQHFGAIQVFDAAGNLTIDASTLDPVRQNSAGEEFFKAHRDSADAGLFISRPTLHRGAYAIVLSRRISGADGSFQGVVAGSIRFSYFHDLFGRLRLGPEDTISVVRRDGTLIMRVPFDLDVIGRDLSQAVGVRRALSEPSGWFSGVGAIDGVSRLYVWRDGSRPLVVIVGKPWSSIYSLWQEQAIRIGSIVMTLICFFAAVAMFCAREIGRRARAENKLEELATTDGLTGLRNRRKFDVTIEAEWRRAMRSGTPIALLMIDADHFKSYNDRFGHQAGDEVLVGIAICISDSVRRAGECAARYGGEEFALLLPGLSSEEALQVAETIRLKVQQWSGDPAMTTVSIGVASLTPTLSMECAALVQAADKALYAAKDRGRNQSVLAAAPKLALVA